MALVALAAAAAAGPASAAQGCGLVTKAELHSIFHANVKAVRGETAADCNFLPPKTGNVLLSVRPMSRARFDQMRKGAAGRAYRETAVGGLGGPAYRLDPKPAYADALAVEFYILHGRYQIQLEAHPPLDQLGETKQATDTQLMALARIIVRRSAR